MIEDTLDVCTSPNEAARAKCQGLIPAVQRGPAEATLPDSSESEDV